MKITYLSPTGEIGGAERVLLQILASLRREKSDWKLHLIAAGNGPLVSEARELGATAEILSFPGPLARLGDFSGLRVLPLASAIPSVIRHIRRLRSQMKAGQPDLIHANGLKMDLLALWARPGNIPVVWHVHDYISARPVTRALVKRYAKRCSGILVNARGVLDDLRTVCPNLKEPYLLYNAVDLKSFSPLGPKLDLDDLAGLEKSEGNITRIGLVATSAHWKGHEIFLEALSLLPQGLSARGYVIGGPIYETSDSQYSLEELRSVARKLGVPNRVGFTGFLKDIPSALRALDIVVQASTRPEPFGMTVLEAMACARPVIASKAGGPEEIIVEGENGLFHTPGDSKSLADRILQLAKDQAFREKLGTAGRKTAEKRFDASELADRLLPIYERILGASV